MMQRSLVNQEGKFLKLFGSILLLVLGFLASLVLLFLVMRLLFGALSYIPFIQYIFTGLVLAVPMVVFATAYIIFFKRTKLHPVNWVRIVSKIIFTVILASWVYFFALDIYHFFTIGSIAIAKYHTWEMIYLSINVATVFLTGVLQALTMPAEQDWLSKPRDY